ETDVVYPAVPGGPSETNDAWSQAEEDLIAAQGADSVGFALAGALELEPLPAQETAHFHGLTVHTPRTSPSVCITFVRLMFIRNTFIRLFYNVHIVHGQSSSIMAFPYISRIGVITHRIDAYGGKAVFNK
ncbi:MAG: hypothetical protein QW512_00600, partial [Thermofilaceae archaeon]